MLRLIEVKDYVKPSEFGMSRRYSYGQPSEVIMEL